MPITLRTPNNPTTDATILGILRNVMHLNLAAQPCTYLAQISASQTGLELTYIQNKYQMALGMTAAIPYAINLSSGRQGYSKPGAGLRTYIGSLVAIVEYCARWDENPANIDNIRATSAADLERIKANIESNDSMAYQGAAYTIAVPSMTLSPYQGTFNAEYPGLTLVERTLSMTLEILPYDCLV